MNKIVFVLLCFSADRDFRTWGLNTQNDVTFTFEEQSKEHLCHTLHQFNDKNLDNPCLRTFQLLLKSDRQRLVTSDHTPLVSD